MKILHILHYSNNARLAYCQKSQTVATDARKRRVLSGITERFSLSVQKHNVSEQKIISFYEVTMKTYIQKFNLLYEL